MSRLPVIVGFGGINPAGRSSGHHGYRRMVIDRIDTTLADSTYQSLASLMNLQAIDKEYILDHTLVRKIENNLFDPSAIRINKTAQLKGTQDKKLTFQIKRKELPRNIPPGWTIKEITHALVQITIDQDMEILFPDHRISKVQSAGQLPSGFEPEKLYQARNHPRGLQLTVYAASDALNSLGIQWNDVRQKIPADQISVYASSAMGQLDLNGAGGMLQSSLLGKRVSSKNCALSLAEMTADFVNAYILGSVGTTGANIGACATFLYNLRQGIFDIRSGKSRAVLVGASEAPITPEVIEGYRTMGALAEDHNLNKLDNREGATDHARACRPFGENCGFTLSESSQFIILFDDELALEMGTNIYGGIADVFVNADGFKKSIPGPGIGNYVTMGKAMGVVRSILGEDAVKARSYIQAHGTSTPQNRVTESHILNELAKVFGAKKMPVAGIKAYLGHSLATASGDQIVATLGTWEHGIIPGINTVDQIADDVHHSHLDILLDHKEVDPKQIDACFINTKGFGGNNATAAILSPDVVKNMMTKKHGKQSLSQWQGINESVKEKIREYDEKTNAGENNLIYKFGVGVVDGKELKIDSDKITIPGLRQSINLQVDNPYDDMSTSE
ncbi:MAG: beta-ketoacyl synthase [Pseudomonadales bacterium]|nr:beta-ketoacyl synthase [Pseudomonadales bacterium]